MLHLLVMLLIVTQFCSCFVDFFKYHYKNNWPVNIHQYRLCILHKCKSSVMNVLSTTTQHLGHVSDLTLFSLLDIVCLCYQIDSVCASCLAKKESIRMTCLATYLPVHNVSPTLRHLRSRTLLQSKRCFWSSFEACCFWRDFSLLD